MPDRLVHLAADAHVVHRIGDPEAQGVIDRGIAVAEHQRLRSRLAQHPRHLQGGGLEQGDHPRRIVVVGGSHAHLAAAHAVGGGVGGGLIGEEHLVGDQQLGVVAIAPEQGGAQHQPAHLAGIAIDHQHLPGPHRALEQQPEAADEIREHLLDAEAEAHREAARHGDQGRGVEPEMIRQPEQTHSHQQVAEHQLERPPAAFADPQHPLHQPGQRGCRRLAAHQQQIAHDHSRKQLAHGQTHPQEPAQGDHRKAAEVVELPDQHQGRQQQVGRPQQLGIQAAQLVGRQAALQGLDQPADAGPAQPEHAQHRGQSPGHPQQLQHQAAQGKQRQPDRQPQARRQAAGSALGQQPGCRHRNGHDPQLGQGAEALQVAQPADNDAQKFVHRFLCRIWISRSPAASGATSPNTRSVTSACIC